MGEGDAIVRRQRLEVVGRGDERVAGHARQLGGAGGDLRSGLARRVPAAERNLLRQLAANVRRLREARSLTIQDPSEKAGMHWRLWQKVEAGGNQWTIQTLARLATALGVTAGELLA